ncbi:MAG: right-handed parallel beta-helix repeat-containing protein [Capsulimonadales bacterium]|nr:right-handed parallel beta-helix repeat-containing protein [Capsulimonadales bacterium]
MAAVAALIAPGLFLPRAHAQESVDIRFIPRVGASFTSAGAGFEGTGAVEGFLPLATHGGRSLLFLEGRVFSETERLNMGGGLLLGRRHLVGPGRVAGGYVALDRRDSGNFQYNQFGIGAETFATGTGLDFRINGYFPFGDRNRTLSNTLAEETSFSGNQLRFERRRLVENALRGFDAEVGAPVYRFSNGGTVRGFVGGYRFEGGEIDGFSGWRVGVAARPLNEVDVSFAVQDDRQFGTRGVFRIALFTSGGYRGAGVTPSTSVARLADPIARQAYLSIARDLIRTRETASDAGNAALRIRHVDLNAPASGDGTAENPFGSVSAALTAAQSGDIVYVRSTGNTVASSGALTIPTGVRVLSSGVVQRIDTAQRTGVLLPGSGTGSRPAIGDTVTLSSGSEINGFAISDTTGAGVLGTDVANVAVQNNVITRPGREGIRLINVTGTVTVAGNTVTDATAILPNAEGVVNSVGGPLFEDKPFLADLDLGGGVSGIRVYNPTAGTLDLRMNRNTVTNSASNGILIGVGGTASITAQIVGNNSSANVGSGIFPFYFGQSNMNLDIRGNTVNDNQGRLFNESGIRFAGFDTAVGVANIEANTSVNNLGNGIFTGANDACKLTATVTANSSQGNQGNGIFSGARRTSELTVTIRENTVSGNRFNPNVIPPSFPNGHGILVGVQEEAKIIGTVDNNNANNNEYNGIYLFGAGSTTLSATVTRNTSNNNGYGGITADIGPIPDGAAARGDLTIRDNIVTDNRGGGPIGQGTGGITLRAFNNSTLSAIVEGNRVQGNATLAGAYAGLGLLATGNSTLLARIRDNIIVGSGTEFGVLAQSPTFAPGKLSLLYRGNTSDKPVVLIRVPNSLFEADYGDNIGAPVIIPVQPVEPLPPNTVP